MAAVARPVTPLSQPRRLDELDHPSIMSTMAMKSEPADPVERAELDLPPKSYAEAAEEALSREDPPIDEDAIKESPPRPPHIRNTSEPRALGEVMDEAERSPPPGSPVLRHPRGRLENKSSQESYASAVKNHPPATDGDANGDGQTPVKRSVTPEKKFEPDTFDGVGEDDAPRSPVRRPHRKSSSRSINAADLLTNGAEDKSSNPNVVPEKLRNKSGENLVSNRPVEGTEDKSGNPNVIYERFRNKSGENLASIRPVEGTEVTRQQRGDELRASKAASARRDSKLVSGRRAGAGWSRSAIRWAPLNVPLQRRLQTLLVLLHSLSIAGCLAFFFLCCAIPLLWPLIVPYLIYALLSPASVDGKLTHRSERMRSSKVWSLFASYFPARLHRTQPLEPTRKYIFGYHPHGIISHGAYIAFSTEALGFSQLFPGITNTLLTLDTNFRVPLYRDYALRMGMASVSRESCENLLSRGGPNGEGMGRAITIVVGGARESLDATPYKMKLVLNRRKGFVKLAIRAGADLVPCLSFGENDLYDQFDSSKHPYVHKAQMLVKKFMGFTVPLFHARGVFNYDVGLMPYRRPVNIVVGRPIPIMQSKTPDPAYVDEIHARYVKELLKIWDDWKDTFAPDRDSELEIIE